MIHNQGSKLILLEIEIEQDMQQCFFFLFSLLDFSEGTVKISKNNAYRNLLLL